MPVEEGWRFDPLLEGPVDDGRLRIVSWCLHRDIIDREPFETHRDLVGKFHRPGRAHSRAVSPHDEIFHGEQWRGSAAVKGFMAEKE